jgi:hypothetical protein
MNDVICGFSKADRIIIPEIETDEGRNKKIMGNYPITFLLCFQLKRILHFH